MSRPTAQPRILFVTPEAVFMPEGNEKTSQCLCPHTGRYGDSFGELISGLFHLGADVYVAQPHYRKIFRSRCQIGNQSDLKKIPRDRVCLTRDRAFFYANDPQHNAQMENTKISLAFQREVIHHVIMEIQPDLLHCHDWMTGLIPANAQRFEIPCVFTVQNPHNAKTLLADVEDIGIDAAEFWQHLFYERYPISYEETRFSNSVDLLLSGIFSANFVNTSSSAFVLNMAENQSIFTKLHFWELLVKKMSAGCAAINSNLFQTQQYIDIYESMLQRSLFPHKEKKANSEAIAS
jgi:starch synthase/alpha-amylase